MPTPENAQAARLKAAPFQIAVQIDSPIQMLFTSAKGLTETGWTNQLNHHHPTVSLVTQLSGQ
jgi:hypothetical protein